MDDQFVTQPDTPHFPYDLEVLVPLCANGKYRHRIEAFRRYGLLNLAGRRVRLVLLVGRSDMAEFIEGWPCDVTAVACDGDSMAAKVHQFYGTLPSGYEKQARWFARVDDDSCTDVGGLLDKLDACYDDRDPDYLMADICRDLDPCYQQILLEIGADGFFAPDDRGKGKTQHEWEGCVLSQTALGRLIDRPLCREFWKRCLPLQEGLADHPLAVAAQIAKIHPADCWFMTSQPETRDFSLLGGRYVHIHFVTWDAPGWPDFTQRLREAGVSEGGGHSLKLPAGNRI